MQAFMDRLCPRNDTKGIPWICQHDLRPSEKVPGMIECLPVRKQLILRRINHHITPVCKGLILIDKEQADIFIFR